MPKTTKSEPVQNMTPKNIEDKIMKSYEKNQMKKIKKQRQEDTKQMQEDAKHIHSNNTKTDKEKLILKIFKYQNNKRFGENIKKNLGLKYTRSQLLKCSIENLESILFRIRNF